VICDKPVDMIALSTAGVAQPKLRRAALFVVNTGSAIIAATVLAEWPMALVGAMTAMVLAFADDDGPLSARLAMLALRVRDGGGRALKSKQRTGS
jgi:hypothetical protein